MCKANGKTTTPSRLGDSRVSNWFQRRTRKCTTSIDSKETKCGNVSTWILQVPNYASRWNLKNIAQFLKSWENVQIYDQLCRNFAEACRENQLI